MGYPTNNSGGRATYRSPKIQAEVNEPYPFLQQPVIYTLRVLSSGNVKTLAPHFPTVDGAAVEKLDDGETHQRGSRGKTEFVTEFRYAVTPLRSGAIDIPPVRVSGTYNQDTRRTSPQTFELTSPRSLQLRVRPPIGSVQPWLPAQSLKIVGNVSSWKAKTAGEPLSLSISMSARGLAGSQLPSLLGQLRSADYKLYRGKSHTETDLSAGGKTLVGKRTESYTLVPQRSGDLRIPNVRIPFWNTADEEAQWASLDGHALIVAGLASADGGGGQANALRSNDSGGIAWGYWVPILTAFGVIAVFWLGAWSRSAGVTARVKGAMADVIGPVWERTGAPLWRNRERFLPTYYYRRLRYRLFFALPTSAKVRYCLKRIDSEQDPSEWCQLLQFVAYRYLRFPVSMPVEKIAEGLAERNNARPQPEKLRALMRDLEATMYGSEPLDFKAWKRSFRKLLRPRLFSLGVFGTRTAGRRGALPELNPSLPNYWEVSGSFERVYSR